MTKNIKYITIIVRSNRILHFLSFCTRREEVTQVKMREVKI